MPRMAREMNLRILQMHIGFQREVLRLRALLLRRFSRASRRARASASSAWAGNRVSNMGLGVKASAGTVRAPLGGVSGDSDPGKVAIRHEIDGPASIGNP